MTKRAEHLLDEAAVWLVRTGDPSFDDWDDFTRWLEVDPAHAEAYQSLAESAASLDPALAQLDRDPVEADVPAVRRTRPWVLAASVAAFAALGITVLPELRGTTYETRPGEMKTITLAAGDTLVLNGGTRITVRNLPGRRVALDRGQMLLRLDGDNHPVTVLSGDLRLVDVGTVFEVARDEKTTRVTVAEGAVMVDPKSARLRLDAGQRLDARDGDALLRAVPAPTEGVGSWTDGQLTYVAEPIERVAADLVRSTGVDFSVDPAMRRLPFSGTLSVAAVRRDPASLGPLLGATVKRSDKQWVIGKG